MNFDFQAIMLIILVISGAIWALDAMFWAPRRRASAEVAVENGAASSIVNVAPKEPVLVEYARTFFPVILIVLILRSFLVEPFRIPSGSMMPTLYSGDFILVNKFSYGIRLPLFNNKVIDIGSPERGDVFVFRYPQDPSIDYIKRVVGLPGDLIGYYGKTLYVNGKPMQQKPLGVFMGTGAGTSMTGADQYVEQLDGVNHDILVRSNAPSLFQGEVRVPEGHYFAMGDNRDNSNDSRVWGFVPEDNLVGKAFMIWMSWNSTGDGVVFDRIGKSIE